MTGETGTDEAEAETLRNDTMDEGVCKAEGVSLLCLCLRAWFQMPLIGFERYT